MTPTTPARRTNITLLGGGRLRLGRPRALEHGLVQPVHHEQQRDARGSAHVNGARPVLGEERPDDGRVAKRRVGLRSRSRHGGARGPTPRRVSTEYPRRSHGDSSPRNIHVAAAASPRLFGRRVPSKRRFPPGRQTCMRIWQLCGNCDATVDATDVMATATPRRAPLPTASPPASPPRPTSA